MARLLSSLTQLDYPMFEVVVVNGPSTDGTDETLAQFHRRVRVARCEERNLSRSRNLGIAEAAGEIVAFIDDDAYPDPAWLDRLVDGFDSPEVAAVGGPVYDHTGVALQARYSLATRFGEAWVDEHVNPTRQLGRPLGRTFPYTIGTNAAFLRQRLVEIGGFDEQFDYYLDETDVCCRLLDRGYLVKLVDDAFVYHKFLASNVRNAKRGIRSRYSIIRNVVYFSLRHGLSVSSLSEVSQSLVATLDKNHLDYRWSVDNGYLTEADYQQYLQDVPLACDAGLEAWLSGPRTREAAWFGAAPERFCPFATSCEERDRLHVCLYSEEYPPAGTSDHARLSRALATGVAAAGHVVHVLTRRAAHPTVDLEDGVWVHRVAPDSQPWAAVLAELRTIDERRPVDVVHVPDRQGEGIAELRAEGFLTVVGFPPLEVESTSDVQASLLELRAGGDGAVRILVLVLARPSQEDADALLAQLAAGPPAHVPVDADELRRQLTSCDAVVALSGEEWFGLSAIEAMRRGKPVVACDAGTVRATVEVGGSGLLVPPGDVEGFRLAIGQLTASPQLRARLGRRGRELYEEAHTFTNMVQGITRYYWSLLAPGAAAGSSEQRLVIAAPHPAAQARSAG